MSIKLQEIVAGTTPPVVTGSGVRFPSPDEHGRLQILVTKLDEIGDFVTALPALEKLIAAWPGAHITLLCSGAAGELASRLRLPLSIVCVDLDTVRSSDEWLQQPEIATLRNRPFEIALDLRHDDDTRRHLFSFNARYRAGFAAGRRLSRRLDVVLPELEKRARRHGHHRLTNQARLCALVECVIASFVIASDHDQAVRSPVPGRSYVVVAPGARHEIKRWSADQWVALCRKLVAAGHDVLLVGDRADALIGNQIEQEFCSTKLSNRIGTASLTDTAETISQARLFIGLDTGLAHLAAYDRTPSIVLFSGHADADVWAPFGPQVVSLRTETPCSPCHARRLRQCLFGHRCMTSITAEHVWAQVEAIVRGGPLR